MNGKAIVPLVAGLCIGGFALKMVVDTVKKAKGATTNMTQVFAAAVDIPLGERITDEMVKPVAFPTAAVPPGAFTKKEKLVGRVSRSFTVAGLPIVDGMLHPDGAPSGLVVKEGYRAVAVKVDESSGVDNHLWPGCTVDVVGYFNIRRAGVQETIARTIIENVEVAAVGQRISLVEPTVPGEKPAKKKETPARAVTLFVKPGDVPTLHLAEQRGKIKLSMRNSMDDPKDERKKQLATNENDVIGLEPVASADGKKPNPFAGMFAGLLGSEKKPEPKPPVIEPPVEQPKPEAKPGFTTVIYRGSNVEQVMWRDRFSRERFTPQPATSDAPAVPAATTPQKNNPDSVQPGPEKNDEHPVVPEETESAVQPAPHAEPQEIDG